MVSIETFRKLALSFENAEEKPHFDRTSFRAPQIFATLVEKEALACLMLSPVDQSVFCAFDKSVIYPVPDKWGKNGATYFELNKVRGKNGATYFELNKVRKDMIKDALTQAYENRVKKKAKK
jgi:hypothetical protein